MQNKTDLRLWAKSIRKTLPLSEISRKIVANIRQNTIYQSAKDVMIFYPMKFEIDLLSLLEDDKNFYLPRVEGEKLCVCPFKKGDELRISALKIKEPCSEACFAKKLDLVIVPALAADKYGYRIGYGGGFYDRFLAENNQKSIIPISRHLLVERLPVEDFDVAADFVITD